MAMGKDKIKGIFVKSFVKTSWVIEEVTCRPTRFKKKMAFKILKDIVPQQHKMYKPGIKYREKSMCPKNFRFGF